MLALVVAVVLLAVSAALVVTGALGLAQKLPGNRWLGVRTLETRRSRRAWDVANRVAGPGFLGGGVMVAGGAAGLLLIDGIVGWLVLVVSVVAAIGTLSYAGYNGARAAAVWADLTGANEPDPSAASCGGGVTGGSTDGTGDDDPGADPAESCGVSGGCGSCQLSGMCTTEAGTGRSA